MTKHRADHKALTVTKTPIGANILNALCTALNNTWMKLPLEFENATSRIRHLCILQEYAVLHDLYQIQNIVLFGKILPYWLIVVSIFGPNNLQTNMMELKRFIWHFSLYSRPKDFLKETYMYNSVPPKSFNAALLTPRFHHIHVCCVTAPPR